MHVLIAPDAFKDSLSAAEVAEAMEEGVKTFSPGAKCMFISASDGGEGFLNAIARYIPNLKVITTQTVDPLGRAIQAEYLYDEAEATAFVELARASGLELLTRDERNPVYTSTFGTGIQIADAISRGAKKVYLGIGGSATNDAGTGIAQALGFRFYASEGELVEPMGANLHKITQIDPMGFKIEGIEFYAINDVLNPLFGTTGAAQTYAKQKGASQNEIGHLDKGLEHLSAVVKRQLHKDEAMTPGSGAAGGTAYGLKCFLNASYLSGTSFILKLSNFEQLLSEKDIDVIITGEGRIDAQTSYGKFVYGIAQEALKYNVPVVAVCGKLDLSHAELQSIGLQNAMELFDANRSISYSYENAKELIAIRTTALLREM
ncbi:MAG: glycerate kinase [Flavobacteriaceae bacterium]|nr:glycerate kinase [Flavobacteriaceae bacterium]